MANRYWVGGTDTWNAAVGSKWSTTSGGAGGQPVPTAADDVFIESGAVVTIGVAGMVCRSLRVASGATIGHSNNIGLTLGDGTAGAGNVALSISSGATVNWVGTSAAYTFVSTSATQQTIDTGGKTMRNIVINGAGSSYILAGNLSMTVTFTLTTGTFDMGGYNLDCASFNSNNSNTRTLTMGAGTFTVGTWTAATTTNLTLSAASSTIVMDTSGGSFNHANTAGSAGTFNILNITNSGTLNAPGSTFATVTKTGIAAKTDTLSLSADLTVTGTLTVNGNSAVNRILIASSVRGTPRSITAAAVSFSNVDFMDVAIPPGAGSVVTSDSFNRSGSLPGSTSDAASGGSGMTWSSASLGTWPITSNEVVPSYGTSGMPSILTLPIGVADVGASVKITGIPSGGSSVAMLILRHTDINNWMSVNIDQGGVLRIGGNIAGSWTANSVVASSGITVSLNDVLRADVIGDVVHVYKNGILGGTWRLSSAQAAAWSGTNHGLGAGAVTNSAKFDDFIVTNLTKMNLSSITGNSGDCGGNSGITFTTPATQSGTGTATLTWSTHSWSGSPSRVPLPQDDVIIANSFIAGRDITADMPRLGKSIDMSSCTGSPRFVNNSVNDDFYGSISFASGMTTSGGNVLTAAGRGTHTITSNGVSSVFQWSINTGGGTYTLADAFTTTANFSVTSGSFATANYTLSVLTFICTGSFTRAVTLGSSTVNITSAGSASVWNFAATGLTLSAASSTIVLTSASSNTRTFVGGGQVYGTVTYTGASSTGTFTITGANYFDTLNVSDGSAARTLTLPASNTTSVNTFNVNGVSGNLISVVSSSASPAYLEILGSPSVCDYLSVTNIYGAIPNKFYAGANSTDVSGNTNVVFTSSPVGGYISLRADASINGSSSISATFPYGLTPVAGRKIIAAYGGTSNMGGTFTPPSGFTEVHRSVNGTSTGVIIFEKVSDGTETTLTFSNSLSPGISTLKIFTLGGFTGTATLDVTDASVSVGSVTSLNTAGAAPSNTANPAVAIGFFQSNNSIGNSVSASNGFGILRDSSEITTARVISKLLTSNAAVSSTYTWTSSRGAVSALVVYKDVQPSTNIGNFFEVF